MIPLAALGCEGASGTVPAEGVVRLNGQPLSGASVHFIPEESGRDATATTDQAGHFVMSTFEPRDGAMAGSYKIVITPSAPAQAAAKPMTPDEAMAEAARVPAKPLYPGFPEQYTRADQTPLKQTVPAPGEIKIDLKTQ
jgi:hypothetical protein